MSVEIYKIKCELSNKDYFNLSTLIEAKDLIAIGTLNAGSIADINLNKDYLYKYNENIQISVNINIEVLSEESRKNDFINIKIDYKNNKTASGVTNNYNNSISSMNDIIGIKKFEMTDQISGEKIVIYLNILEELKYPLPEAYHLKGLRSFRKCIGSPAFNIIDYLSYMDFNDDYELFLSTLAFLDYIIRNYKTGIQKEIIDLYIDKLYYIGIDLDDYYKEGYDENDIYNIGGSVWKNKKEVIEYLLRYINYILTLEKKAVAITFSFPNVVANVYRESIYIFL